jgi:integrase
MTKWVKDDSIGQRELWRREAIQDYLLIMFNSGLREHELFKRDEKTKVMRGLRWKDVEFFTSKAGSELVELYVEGKTGSRYMVPLRAVRFVLERRKLRCPNAGPEDYVMALPDGTLFNTFDSGVGGVLTLAGLRKDPKSGRNRGIYSCRHSYATRQVQDDVNAQELSENMGTSVAMLNRSYFHFNARDAADRLSGSKAKDRNKG